MLDTARAVERASTTDTGMGGIVKLNMKLSLICVYLLLVRQSLSTNAQGQVSMKEIRYKLNEARNIRQVGILQIIEIIEIILLLSD